MVNNKALPQCSHQSELPRKVFIGRIGTSTLLIVYYGRIGTSTLLIVYYGRIGTSTLLIVYYGRIGTSTLLIVYYGRIGTSTLLIVYYNLTQAQRQCFDEAPAVVLQKQRRRKPMGRSPHVGLLHLSTIFRLFEKVFRNDVTKRNTT